MSEKTKGKIQGALKNIEKNFQQLVNNVEVKRVLNDMKKLKSKRTKQIDKMLTNSWDNLQKGYAKDAHLLEKLFTKEKNKINKVFQEQLNELKKIKSAVEDHLSSSLGKKINPGKIAKGKARVKRKSRTKKIKITQE